MNILLVIFNNDIENSDVFEDRIKALGDTFHIFSNMVFVETESSSKEVYEKLSSGIYENSLMLILYVHNELFGFWGRMNTKLWDWLKEREENTKNGLIQNYKVEISKMGFINKEQADLIENLKTAIEDYQKNIELLYQTNEILERKLKELMQNNSI